MTIKGSDNQEMLDSCEYEIMEMTLLYPFNTC